MIKVKIVFLFLVMILTGCATFSLTKESLKEQLINGDAYYKTYIPILYSEYISNNIEKILCINSDGEKVYLFPNLNTQLEITTKSGYVFKAYFDTVFFNGDKISGLRSRLIGGKIEVFFEEIKKVEIYAENAKTVKYNEKSK